MCPPVVSSVVPAVIVSDRPMPPIELVLQVHPDLAAGHVQTGEDAGIAEITESQWQQWFQAWLDQLQPQLIEAIAAASGYELTLRLTDDAEIQTLNANYRDRDQPTDVLAFAALEVECPQPEEWDEPLYLGDIVISVDTANRQAQQQGHSLRHELAWLAAHGCLHLLGWDHPDEASLERMLDQQVLLLNQVGIAINCPVMLD